MNCEASYGSKRFPGKPYPPLVRMDEAAGEFHAVLQAFGMAGAELVGPCECRNHQPQSLLIQLCNHEGMHRGHGAARLDNDAHRGRQRSRLIPKRGAAQKHLDPSLDLFTNDIGFLWPFRPHESLQELGTLAINLQDAHRSGSPSLAPLTGAIAPPLAALFVAFVTLFIERTVAIAADHLKVDLLVDGFFFDHGLNLTLKTTVYELAQAAQVDEVKLARNIDGGSKIAEFDLLFLRIFVETGPISPHWAQFR